MSWPKARKMYSASIYVQALTFSTIHNQIMLLFKDNFVLLKNM